MSDWVKTAIALQQKKREGRSFEIYTKDFTSAEQAVPVPVVFGTVRIAGTYITPIWSFRAKKIKQKVGK